ncbi:hypothetical protein ACSSS7_003642 [Eimeria intestinalis]
MWGRIVSSVSNALDFNQATLSGCIDIICVRNPHTSELHSTPFHVRFGKAKLLRSREKIVTVTVNGQPTSLVMKLGAAGEAYFMQEVEDNDGVAEEDLASPLCSPVHSPRRVGSQPVEASLLSVPQDAAAPLPPSHPAQGATLSTAASAVATDTRKTADSMQDAARDSENLSPSSEVDALSRKADLPSSLSVDASSTWRSAWGTAARYDASGAALSDASPTAGFPEAELSGSGRGEDPRAAVQFSLCGHVLFGSADEAQHDADVFKANVVTWEALDENPSLWYHPSLVACFERTPPYYPAKVALPLLASWILFNRPLSLNSVKRLMTAEIAYTDREGPGWAAWQTDGVGSSSGILRPRPDPLSSAEFSQGGKDRDQHQATSTSGVNSDSEFPVFPVNTQPSSGKRLRRSLRPTPQQLESLDLKPGANSVCFTVSSSLQGEKSVCGTIYLWPTDIKIVVSDVDGTITRSDVLGQLMPIVGRDWSHTGVAELFTKIKRSGYLILYLTARAIGQADATRDYLFGLTQKERDKLPEKVFLLVNDHRAYIHVGIPEAKIFIIDTAGVIHHISNTTYARTYETMSEIADHMFPPLKNSPVARGQTGQEFEEREEEEVRQRKRLQYTLFVDKRDDTWVSPTALCCSGFNDESTGSERKQMPSLDLIAFFLMGALLSLSPSFSVSALFNAFNYWSVAFEPHSECGESEGGNGDEGDASSVVVAAAAGLTLPVKSATVDGLVGVQQQQLPGGSGGKRLVLSYYFGQDHTDSAAASVATQAATAAACLAVSACLGGTSARPDDVLFDSQSSSSSSNTSSSSSSSSSSISSSSCSSSSSSSCSQLLLEPSLPEGQLFSRLEEEALFSSPQQFEGLRRSASAGAELASLDNEQRETSGAEPQQQPQRPVTATAPGMLLLPSVVSLSSFRGLGSLAFRRGAVAAGAASAVPTDAAPAAASAPAATATAAATNVHDVQAGTPASSGPRLSGGDCSRSTGRLSGAETVGAEASLRGLEGGSSMSSSPAASLSNPSLPQGSGKSPHAGPPAFSAAAASKETFQRVADGEKAEAAPNRGASRSLLPPLLDAGAALVGDLPAAQPPGVPPARAASAAGTPHSGPWDARENAGCLESESASPTGSACTVFAFAAGAPVDPGELEATRADALDSAVPHAALGVGQNLTIQPSSSDRKSVPAPPRAPVSAGSQTRLWLPRSAREMRACSSTSAMFMALAQDTPRLIRPTGGSPQLDASRLTTAGAPAAAERPANSPSGSAASRVRILFGGAAEALGSYTSFESTDLTTSRCDSFASAASCSRAEEETHAPDSAQQLQQQQDSLQQQLQQHNDDSAAAQVSLIHSQGAEAAGGAPTAESGSSKTS